jgi:hypothetical protein
MHLVYIQFHTQFGLPSVMFKALHYNLSCIYKPATPFLPCTHLHITEQILFFDIEGASAKTFMKGVKCSCFIDFNNFTMIPLLGIICY